MEQILQDTEAALKYYQDKGDVAKVELLEKGFTYFLRTFVTNVQETKGVKDESRE